MNELSSLERASSTPRAFSVHSIHMVRTAMTNHMALSRMADQKANILMGMTFLVFTLSMREFDAGHYRYSLLVLVVFAFVSAMLAMGAVMPRTRAPKLSDDDLDNLLFFGVFTGLDQEEFVRRVLDRGASDEAVLTTMLRDIYQNGTVLQRQKYRFLSLAFQCFRAGLVLAMIAFLIENRQALAVFLRLA
ncbi:Pycsar system effector family protein [Novosphingobium sp. BL-8A]|uniref:Pycsar system effector family protein n=1 Tax=Novosphingobium sp. BL-8A TaxID=3127639 RepID=UPI003756410C